LLEGADLETLTNTRVLPEHETEKALVKLVAEFPEAVKAAAQSYNPSKIAAHVYELAKLFNAF